MSRCDHREHACIIKNCYNKTRVWKYKLTRLRCYVSVFSLPNKHDIKLACSLADAEHCSCWLTATTSRQTENGGFSYLFPSRSLGSIHVTMICLQITRPANRKTTGSPFAKLTLALCPLVSPLRLARFYRVNLFTQHDNWPLRWLNNSYSWSFTYRNVVMDVYSRNNVQKITAPETWTDGTWLVTKRWCPSPLSVAAMIAPKSWSVGFANKIKCDSVLLKQILQPKATDY